jgi:hypothetical protein
MRLIWVALAAMAACAGAFEAADSFSNEDALNELVYDFGIDQGGEVSLRVNATPVDPPPPPADSPLSPTLRLL